ncbi:MAG: hypothetical protein WCD79_01955 [Chthoniobacteraceae bacterium]
MNNPKLTKLLTIAASAALTLLPACSSVPVASNIAETDFTLTGGYTDPATQQAYTGSATAAIKYTPSPASPNVPTGATAASQTTATAAAPSPSTATSSSQPKPQ